MKKRLFVVDGHALCYRAYFAFIKNPLVNSSGQNTSAIFGFARMLIRLIDEQKPDYLIVAFDPPRKSFRFSLYPEYKANREKMPDDLRSQIEEIKNMVRVMEICQVEEADFEADDVLGSLAHRFGGSSLEVVLVTGDKDAYQLVGDHVRIYANRKGIAEFEWFDSDAVVSRLGIPPEKVIDYMALTGDSSDNVPGVRGIGEKTALKLIGDYGTLEEIYGHLGDIRGKLREQLESGREMAFLSRTLVTIRTDIPLSLDLEKARLPEIRREGMRDYFLKMEMKSLAEEMAASGSASTPAAPAERDYRVIRTGEDLAEMIRAVERAGLVSVDTETTSLFPVQADLVGISLSIREGAGWYIPIRHATLFDEEFLPPEVCLKALKSLLENPALRKVGQNIKYDLLVLRRAGIDLQGIWFDTMIASYLLNPSERGHNLDSMAEKYLQYKTIKYEELVGKGKNAVSLTDVPVDRVAEYAIEDADIAYRLHLLLARRLEEEGLTKLFRELEMPLLSVLAQMEWDGVRIDRAHFTKLAEENERLLRETEAAIYAQSGGEFNINSTRELAGVLFERLKLKPVKKTKTGFSTDISVLEELRGRHEIIDHLIAYRTYSKLKTTYIDTLPRLVNPETGRIHTSYNQTVVATGRLSSSDPNLQNIPVRDDFGRKIREGFIPEKGWRLVSADYSQIELRLAAHLSGDENMIRAFREGTDIHSLTASSVFGVDLNSVTPDMRRQAKIINFATIYGVSPYGLSQQADISIQEAAEFIKRYFETYPGFRKYIDETTELARQNGYVTTLMGRKRFIPDINSTNVFRREGAERIAINTPIQGTSADLIKIAMLNIQKALTEGGLKTRMILQVHDELVFEVPSDEMHKAEDIVKREMERALDLKVPPLVEMGEGMNWAEAH